MKEFGQGLIVSLYGLGITFLALAFLGFILSLFKYIFRSDKAKPQDLVEEEEALAEEVPDETHKKKVTAAISVALAEFMSNKRAKTTVQPKVRRSKSSSNNNFNKIIKAKRWRNE